VAEPSFLLVRLGSLGDILHTLPSAAALRDTFPAARIDWAVEPRWVRLLSGNPDINGVISANRTSLGGLIGTLETIRATRYTCAVDFQALYKSALLAWASRAPRRIGFKSSYAREGLASLLYTDRVNPRGPHKVDHNLTLVEAVGARRGNKPRFPLSVGGQDRETVAREIARASLPEFFVLNPGGGWVSKCWPPERYGQLHSKLVSRFGWRGVVTFGPSERGIAQRVLESAGQPAPIALPVALGPLMALLERAKFVVSADTGPLHLASALGAPVVGLYGPTDPSRNGPFSRADIVVRNPQAAVTTYRREASYSPSMLSISVEQVVQACERRLGLSA